MTVAAGIALAATPAAFAQGPNMWASPDGRVRLHHPAGVAPTTDDRPIGSLMSGGWRMIWDGKPVGRGRMLVRFAMKVAPRPPLRTATEVLQIGASSDPEVIASCRTHGLTGGSAMRQPDRTIHGVRYAVWRNGDAGMSQRISATDLRALVGGTCYAIARFAYGEAASDGNPLVTLPQARGAAMLDTALASLKIRGAAPGDK